MIEKRVVVASSAGYAEYVLQDGERYAGIGAALENNVEGYLFCGEVVHSENILRVNFMYVGPGDPNVIISFFLEVI